MAQAERGVKLDGPVGIWADESGIRESKFFAEYLNRLVSGRDMHTIITASSETGVGKTTLAASLAILFDQHGWTAEKAAVADAAQYATLYDDTDEVQPGSVLLLDEAEKAADARRGTSTGNVEVSQAFAAKRYRQVFGMLTAPTKSWVDDRLGSDSADYWIQALQTDMGRIKGEAKVYRLKKNEHYEQSYTERTEYIHWPILDWHREFQRLDKRKQEILESDTESAFIRRSEHEEELERARRDERQEVIQEVIERMANSDEYDFTQHEIAEAVDRSQGTVSTRLKEGR